MSMNRRLRGRSAVLYSRKTTVRLINDRHVEAGHGEKIAYEWEGDGGVNVSITYRQLLIEVSKLANVLKSLGVKKGDRVCIYMPMIPEAIYAMLACTRIGAVHSVVFAGFSSNSSPHLPISPSIPTTPFGK